MEDYTIEAKLNVVKSKNSRKNYSWFISFYGPISFILAFILNSRPGHSGRGRCS